MEGNLEREECGDNRLMWVEGGCLSIVAEVFIVTWVNKGDLDLVL